MSELSKEAITEIVARYGLCHVPDDALVDKLSCALGKPTESVLVAFRAMCVAMDFQAPPSFFRGADEEVRGKLIQLKADINKALDAEIAKISS